MKRIDLITIFVMTFITFGECEISPGASLENVPALFNDWFKRMHIYTETLENHLNMLKRELSNFDNLPPTLEDPISIFLALKIFSRNFDKLQNEFKLDYDFLTKFNNLTLSVEWPNDNELQKTAFAIERIQDTYNLNSSDLCRGLLTPTQIGLSMSARDCLELGLQFIDIEKFAYADSWLVQALINFEVDPDIGDTQKDILKSFVKLHDRQENYLRVIEILEAIRQKYPDDESFATKLLFYKHKVKKLSFGRGSDSSEDKIEELQHAIMDNKYKELCRNDRKKTPKEMASLKCRYVTNNSPFLKIAPLKMEEYSHDPYVAVFYDVLYDQEIEVIKKLATPKIDESTTGPATEGLYKNDYRTSKHGWLNDDDHPFIRDLSQRAEDITGLTTKSAEELQVVNYGTGDHYKTHHDFHLRSYYDEIFEDNNGNRIATLLFYMNDVEAGGATVFPLIDVAVPPIKGSALFWYNLHKSGKGHYKTAHAGCPIIVGTKWACNKWLHEFGQEFRRPCDLSQDDPEELRHISFL